MLVQLVTFDRLERGYLLDAPASFSCLSEIIDEIKLTSGTGDATFTIVYKEMQADLRPEFRVGDSPTAAPVLQIIVELAEYTANGVTTPVGDMEDDEAEKIIRAVGFDDMVTGDDDVTETPESEG